MHVAATVGFTQSQFSAFENESPLVATLEASALVGISFEVFVIATPLTGHGGAGGKCVVISDNHVHVLLNRF